MEESREGRRGSGRGGGRGSGRGGGEGGAAADNHHQTGTLLTLSPSPRQVALTSLFLSSLTSTILAGVFQPSERSIPVFYPHSGHLSAALQCSPVIPAIFLFSFQLYRHSSYLSVAFQCSPVTLAIFPWPSSVLPSFQSSFCIIPAIFPWYSSVLPSFQSSFCYTPLIPSFQLSFCDIPAFYRHSSHLSVAFQNLSLVFQEPYQDIHGTCPLRLPLTYRRSSLRGFLDVSRWPTALLKEPPGYI